MHDPTLVSIFINPVALNFLHDFGDIQINPAFSMNQPTVKMADKNLDVLEKRLSSIEKSVFGAYDKDVDYPRVWYTVFYVVSAC